MAQTGAKGSLALTVDELGLEASLRFTPDPNGAEWTADKLMRLVMDARIGGMTQRRADELLGKFARSRGAAVEVIAKGLVPEEPVPEEAEWEELEPPPEFADIVAATVIAAGPPELYRVRVETFKTEKTVKKPGALPFLPPKIEKVEIQEKREVKEAIYPDAAVLKTGFARRGQRLGLISPSKQGKQGKSIFGKPISPEGKDTAFILGSGVVKNKSELLADLDGVFRAGARWAEVIPLAIPSWSVGRSVDGATWLLTYTAGDSRLPAPGAAEILAAAVAQGAPEGSLISEADLAAILAEAVGGAGTAGANFSKSLSLDRDGGAEVLVSPDRVRAVLHAWKGRGNGRRLELAQVTEALKKSGVRPPKLDQFKKDVLEFYKGEEVELVDYVLAEGKAPTRGKDRTVSLNVAFLADDKAQELKARLIANPALSIVAPSLAEFPMEEATKLAFVQAGQRFCELSAQAPGQPGVDVAGQAIPAIPGNDPSIKTYENIVVQKGAITAAAAGVLVVAEKEGAYAFRVIPFKDSSIEVSVSPDSMSAYVNIQAEVGLGVPLTVEGVLAAIAAKGVVQGLDPKAVTEAVVAARSGQVVLRRLIASGSAPRAAGAARRIWLLGQGAPFEGAKPVGVEALRVPAGTPILKIELPSGASAVAAEGVNVLGGAVKPSDAAQLAPPEGAVALPEIAHDASIAVAHREDGAVLYSSAVAGELRFDGARLSIVERLVVKGDVGPESGNLRFAGPIHVGGSVRRGFQLIAGGDAAVNGNIEASLVSSDGAIAVTGGIRGERRGTLRAKRSIDVGFAEQALLLAVEDIRVRGSCALCSVKTNGRLLVTGDKGALVGGLCRARKGVDAVALGSENGIKTEISFGQDYLVADMIEAEEKEIEKLKLLIVQSDRAMADAERTGAGLDQARQDKVKMVKLLEKRSIRLFDLREKFEEHCAASEVIVRGTVFPGVILESHNRFFEVRSKKANVAFAFDQQQGRIVERRL